MTTVLRGEWSVTWEFFPAWLAAAAGWLRFAPGRGGALWSEVPVPQGYLFCDLGKKATSPLPQLVPPSGDRRSMAVRVA